MTPSEFVSYQRDNDPGSAIPESDFDLHDTYDVVYRSLACLLAPTCLGVKKSCEEAEAFLGEAHPYFVHVLSNPKGRTLFKNLHKVIYDAWYKGEVK
jgi:hypothetical protein